MLNIKQLQSPHLILIAAFLGIIIGKANILFVQEYALILSKMFVSLLKLISFPMIFLSLVSTMTSMHKEKDFKFLAKKILFYTLLTTFCAASVACFMYILIDPVATDSAKDLVSQRLHVQSHDNMIDTKFLDFFWKIIPDNFFQPFLNSNVFSVLFLALLVGGGTLRLELKHKSILNDFFAASFALVLKIAGLIVHLVPLSIFCFLILFMKDMDKGYSFKPLMWYVFCVVGANLVQAVFVLPSLLIFKRINPKLLFGAMWPALTLAFFSKSSSAALPLSLKCAEERAHLNHKVARFSFPMCTTINMNACAAFIFITVIFVSQINGASFSYFQLILWIFIASISAVGNAAVPMGCYFLASSLLAANNVPIEILGLILPVYALIDMLETAINVWSDSCVCALVDKDLSHN